MIKIKRTKKYGRGVYSDKNISKGEIVEKADVILINDKDESIIQLTDLKYFVYDCDGKTGVGLGVASLFNHSNNPNIQYFYDPKANQLIFIAKKNIKKGTQLMIDYGYEVQVAKK